MLTINDSGFLFFGTLVFNIFALYFICLDSCPWEVCVLSWFACFCNFQFLQFIFLHFSFSVWDEDGKKSPINGSVFPPPGTALSSEGHFSCQSESGWDYPTKIAFHLILFFIKLSTDLLLVTVAGFYKKKLCSWKIHH